MRSDGCLEHLGRKDSQVKIRGYRVEMAEVTSALLKMPEIGDAYVAARQDSTGEVYLVAFLVLLEGEAAELPGNLRQALSERLPSYMHPSKTIVLEALPRTPTGKVDAQALKGMV
jgi:acyl-coenzyme A synthetase/AMP-(fatty) acid ligase